MIDMVDIKVIETSAARPEKTVETANLPEQFALRVTDPFGGKGGTDRSVHAVAAHQNDIANLAVLNALMKLLERPAVAGHQADTAFLILRAGLFPELEH